MAAIPLEDNYTDVLGKAQRGRGLNDAALARQAGVSKEELARFRAGEFDPNMARRVAGPLGLGAGALIELGEKSWYPEPVEVAGLASFNTAYQDMTVNSYLVFDAKTLQAAAFDTGASAAGMIAFIKERKLAVELILLTHTHPDHVADLSLLEKATGVAAYVSEREQFQGPRPFEPGVVFQMGRIKVETRETSGHSRGGITYVVTGLKRGLAVVGDALFAASMGGGAVSYQQALRTNRKEIFTLPDDTVICPGHGPMTTVGEQKKHNPFYPEFQS